MNLDRRIITPRSCEDIPADNRDALSLDFRGHLSLWKKRNLV